jgi:hypothetical protein
VTVRGRTADFAASAGLGAPLYRVRLRGRLPVESIPTPVELYLTSRGLWLVAARDGQGASIDLLQDGRLRYVPGRTSDQLIVDERSFGTPPGRSRAVRETIALGRLRDGGSATSSHAFPAKGSYLVRELDARATALLMRELLPDELVVAFVASSTRAELPSALAPKAPARCFWLITDRRCSLLGLTELGDVRRCELEPAQLRLHNGRLDVTQDRALWFRQSSLLAGRLLELSRMTRGERLTAAAELEWEADNAAWAQRLLRAAAPEHADAAFALELVSCDAGLPEVPVDLGAALERLRQSDAPPETLAALWRGWSGSQEAARVLLGRLRPFASRAEPWALELHHSLIPGRPRSPVLLELAAHQLSAGRAAEAKERLAPLLGQSPTELDLLALEPVQSPRLGAIVQSYELAIEAAEALNEDTLPLVWSLARLDPLAPERLLALARVAPPELRARARAALALLGPRGFARDSQRPEPPASDEPPPAVLSRELLERRLRHPLARARATAAVQGALASSSDPDRELLRSWCERLLPGRYPAVVRAADRARHLLGLPPPELFVSRGERSLGVRAFGGKTTLLVIGSAHLEPSSAARLSESELCFALGAELAHVRFGHDRATPREVWVGALSKARIGMEVVLAAVPLAKSLELGARASRLLDRVPTQAVQRALGVVADLQHSLDRREPGSRELGRRHEELVEAHQQQQLTADRAGLLACGRLDAALGALFTLRPDHQSLLQAICSAGIGPARLDLLLDHPELLLRLKALIAFYLSPDYALLSGAS